MVAMICGCSLRISSATDCESIHFSDSMPDASLPPRMRDSSTEALSSPSALVRTWRMYSSESRPTVEAAATMSRKFSSVPTTSSCGTFFMVAMAAPSLSTSRGPRNFITSAASLSPRASIRMAAFCSPVDSVIITYPCFDLVGHDAGIFLRQFLGHCQVFAVAAGRIFFQFLQLFFAEQDVVFFARLGQRRFGHGWRGAKVVDLAHHGAQHRAHDLDEQIQQDQGGDQEFRQFLGQRQVSRIAPPLQLAFGRTLDAVEGRIGHAEAVAAFLVVTHGLFDKVIDLHHFSWGNWRHRDLAILVEAAAVVDHHRHRQPAQAAHRFLFVAHCLVDFIIGRRFLLRGRRWRGRRCAWRFGRQWRRSDARRLVRQCTGHARWIGIAGARRFARLLAADGRRLRRRIRLVGFGRLFGLRKIHVRRRFGAHVAFAYDGQQDRFDLLDHALLQLLHVFQLVWIEVLDAVGAVAVLVLVRQQVAGLVHHRYIHGQQFRHAGRYQVHDGAYLQLVEATAWVQVEKYGSRGFLLVAHKNLWFGQGQVDPCRIDSRDRFYCFGQLAFQCTLEIDLFQELRHAQFLVFNQLEAHIATLGQALRCQFQARIVDLLGWHEDGAAALGKLVLDTELVQRGRDGAAVAVGKIGKQHLVFRWLVPHVQRYADGDQRRHAQAAQEILAHWRLGEGLHGLHGRTGGRRWWLVQFDVFRYSHDGFPGACVCWWVVAASDERGGDRVDYPSLSRASIAQIEGAFAACSAEQLALALVLWDLGNTW